MDISDWIAFIGVIVAIMIPMMGTIMRLNSTITRLNVNMEHKREDGQRRNHRLAVHSDKLDHLETKVAEHDIEIQNLKDHQNCANRGKII